MGMYKTPKCSHKCTDSSYETGSQNDKTKGAGVYAVRGEAKIMQDLMTNGPQAVAFKVYTDFETYKSGVYQHHSGTMAGARSSSLVGGPKTASSTGSSRIPGTRPGATEA